MVPKTVMSMFIKQVISDTENELMRDVLKDPNQKNLVSADKNKMAKAQQLEKELDNLKKTMSALDRL